MNTGIQKAGWFSNLSKKLCLREPRYLINSVLDFQDFWMNLMILGIGIAVLMDERMMEYYSYVSKYFISEKYVASYFVVSSSVNIVRLIYPKKINVLLVSLLKTFTLSCFILLFFSAIYHSPIYVSSVIYGILVLASTNSLLRST